MKQYVIRGISPRTYDFVADDGRKVHTDGVRLFLSCPIEGDGASGEYCFSVYISNARLGDYVPVVNDVVTFAYNRFGKVDAVRKVK